jgi:hypothetical protein
MREKASKVSKKPVDAYSEKQGKGRGRPRECIYSEILGRAENYRNMFTDIWPQLCGPLLAAQNEDEVSEAFRSHGEPHGQQFVPRLAGDILKVIREKKFPKRARTQIKFLANSLAGRPNVEARTSRDICAEGLAEEKTRSPYRILRKEFYVECSCGFKGPALNDACRKCGAHTFLLPGALLEFG